MRQQASRIAQTELIDGVSINQGDIPFCSGPAEPIEMNADYSIASKHQVMNVIGHDDDGDNDNNNSNTKNTEQETNTAPLRLLFWLPFLCF